MSVPCNGCRRCCIGDAVRIMPHEDASQWRTEPHDKMPGARMLAHKRNGECVYLDEHGCSIHDKPRPSQCVTMDCRRLYLALTWTQARRLGVKHIWQRGRELIQVNRIHATQREPR